MTPTDVAWAVLKSDFVNYSQGFSGFTPETAGNIQQVEPRPNPMFVPGGGALGLGGNQPQYNEQAAAMLGQGYESYPTTLEQSLTQAQQNAYAQGNAPEMYGRMEMMNPFNKDPNIRERRTLDKVRENKNIYRRVTPSHRQSQAGLDRAGGVPVQEYHTRRAANAFARANQ